MFEDVNSLVGEISQKVQDKIADKIADLVIAKDGDAMISAILNEVKKKGIKDERGAVIGFNQKISLDVNTFNAVMNYFVKIQNEKSKVK